MSEAPTTSPGNARTTVRRLQTAEVVTVGTELTRGETADTNAHELAAELAALGVEVRRLSALPDELGPVVETFRVALRAADLIVSTGGLGPTPDDLTREAIAEACGETPAVDPSLEASLRELFQRRGLRMADANRKQAWLIPSASPLPNENGTAPGWWVDRTDGRVIVAMPGPPREMRAMWATHVLPRLLARGLGDDRASETLRLTGIGESALVELLGEQRLRASNPAVATYARPDAVDLRITAVAADGRSASQMLQEAVRELEPLLRELIFARGTATWADALRERLGDRRVAVVEMGLHGHLAALLGGAPWLRRAEVIGAPMSRATDDGLERRTAALRREAAVEVALGVAVETPGTHGSGDTAVSIAIAREDGVSILHRTAFLRGDEGLRRAAVVAAAELWRSLGPEA